MAIAPRPDVLPAPASSPGPGTAPDVAMITVRDLAGERWNGFDLMQGLRRRGVAAAMFVDRKLSDDPDVHPIARFRGRDAIDDRLTRLERALSLQSVLYPWGEWIVRHPRFRRANLVHLHIFHMEFLSLWSLPRLARGRRLLVTLHDLWPLTGHCVHPKDCDRLLVGCGACPDLGLPFPMRRDRTAAMVRRKRDAFRKARAWFHVTTDYMQDMARRAFASQGHPCVKIPLGVDTSLFRPATSPEERAALRARLGIAQDRFVVGLRATGTFWKGLPIAIEAFRRLAGQVPLAIVAFQDRGAFAGLPGVQVVELGWAAPPELTDAYRCMDLFLMPSSHESFGYMGLEAMASGTPVLAFSGTALSELLGRDGCGFLVDERSAEGVARAILAASRDRGSLAAMGARSRERAVKVFGRERYEDEMLALYRRMLEEDE